MANVTCVRRLGRRRDLRGEREVMRVTMAFPNAERPDQRSNP